MGAELANTIQAIAASIAAVGVIATGVVFFTRIEGKHEALVERLDGHEEKDDVRFEGMKELFTTVARDQKTHMTRVEDKLDVLLTEKRNAR
jgi:hypothetical protein